MEALYNTGYEYTLPLINMQEKAVAFTDAVQSGFEELYDIADVENPYWAETAVRNVIDDNAKESRIAPIN